MQGEVLFLVRVSAVMGPPFMEGGDPKRDSRTEIKPKPLTDFARCNVRVHFSLGAGQRERGLYYMHIVCNSSLTYATDVFPGHAHIMHVLYGAKEKEGCGGIVADLKTRASPLL